MQPLGNTFIADLNHGKVNEIRITKNTCVVGYSHVKTQGQPNRFWASGMWELFTSYMDSYLLS